MLGEGVRISINAHLKNNIMENQYQNIKSIFSETVQGVVDGELDSLEIYAQMKDFEKFFKECKSKVEEEALIDAEKFEAKTFEHKGLSFERRDGKRTYDFKHISDWTKKKDELAEVERKAKAAASHDGTFVDDDGVVVEPCVVKYSKSSLIVKAKK